LENEAVALGRRLNPLGESIDHPNGHAVKTPESKETRAKENDGNAQFSLCCTSTKPDRKSYDPAFFWHDPLFPTDPLKLGVADLPNPFF
jgi:hypothetical protein